MRYAHHALQDLVAGKRAIHDVQELSRGSLRLAMTHLARSTNPQVLDRSALLRAYRQILHVSSDYPFKGIADVLGHHSLQGTVIDAKLDLAALSRIAMPWPGEKA